jgi:uncharacterized membrane protein YjgN (DUF898 family)
LPWQNDPASSGLKRLGEQKAVKRHIAAGAHMECQYTILGVDADASNEEISSAYAAALARFRKALSRGEPIPVDRLDAVRTAYRTLSNADLRRAHDVERSAASAASLATITAPAAAAATAVVPKAAPPREVEVEFRGSGGEYFRIWLVNIALTVLTLGIYSAWAKVRREKYFHRNMVVDGSAFDYHGTPRAIFIGRCILALFLILASVAEYFGPKAKLVASLLVMIVFPWLLVQSTRFRARNTSYRGIRFHFSGRYRNVLFLFLVHGSLCVLTLGLYFPAFLQKQKAFVARHLSYGNIAMRFKGDVGDFYRGLAFPLILWCLALAIPVAIGWTIIPGGKSKLLVLAFFYGMAMFVALIVFTQLILVPYARVVGTNLFWNHLRVGRARFRSTQKVRSYIAIVLSNWLLTLLTLGFFWPLAQIRLARFRARNLVVFGPDGLADITASEQREASAVGGEAMAALDFDIAI